MSYEDLLDSAYSNIKVNIEDTTSRFEVPKVIGHHEKNKTVLTNFFQIASHIRRDSNHIIKFLTRELASQAEVNNDRLLLSRRLSSKEINDRIQKYVNSFVLCPKCKKPDTKIIEENSKIFIQCLACGNKSQINKL